MLGKLISVQGSESFYLTRPEITVGSDEGCDVVIQHRSVEPLHCTLEYHDGTWFVEDHGTRTGVRVDGDRFDSTYIPVYSVLSIGTVQFEVHYRAGAPVAVGADSEASNVWPSVNGETGAQFSSGGRLTGAEDELLLAPDDDSGVNLRDGESSLGGEGSEEGSPSDQRPAFKRLGFLSPLEGDAPHRLLKERLYLGRDPDCDVVVPGLDVAPLHCVMELRDGYWHVRNLKDNGVAIDGKKLSESWLIPGAVLSICGHEFSVDYEPEGDAPASADAADVSGTTAVSETAAVSTDEHPDAHHEIVSREQVGREPLLSDSDESSDGPDDSTADAESALSLDELAAEADELFNAAADGDQDVSVAAPTAGEIADEIVSQQDVVDDASVDGSQTEDTAASVDVASVDAADDSRTELASSKTFLLFENPDDEPSVAEGQGVTAASSTESSSHSHDGDQPSAVSVPESDTSGSESESDFELRTPATTRSELPGLFCEDDEAAADASPALPSVAGNETTDGSGLTNDAKPQKPISERQPAETKPAATGSPRTDKSAAAGAASLFPNSAARAASGEENRSHSAGLDVAALTVQRHEQVIGFLDAQSLDGLILTRPSSIAWMTAGIHSGPELSGTSALVITRDECSMLARDVDARLLTRELASIPQFHIRPYAWQESLTLQLEQLCSDGRFASDGDRFADVADASADLTRMRLPMERPERRELRRLGHQVAHAVEATLRNFHRGATEAEIAGQLSNRLFRHGVTAEQIQVYADDRRGDYRRAKFDRRPVEDGCTLSVTARRHGLHVAASRTVCFGTPDRQILDDHALSLVVQATALVFSKHEWPIADAWKRVHRIYEKIGRADQSLRVEPGWVTGYERSEAPILPDSDFQLLAGMPVIWQAGVGTALSVDTVLIANGGIDILTPSEFWPTRRVAVKRVELQRPDILIRNDD